FARVDMRLRDGLDLPADSFATRRADSLFGDSYVEIIPSGGEAGASTARRLQSGEPIAHVVEGTSTDAVLRAIATALPRIDNALEVGQDRLLEGRKWIDGPAVERLTATDEWLAQGHVEAPIEAASRAVSRLDDLTARGADRMTTAGPDVAHALDRIDDAI